MKKMRAQDSVALIEEWEALQEMRERLLASPNKEIWAGMVSRIEKGCFDVEQNVAYNNQRVQQARNLKPEPEFTEEELRAMIEASRERPERAAQ